jgi:hypothetical protein
VKRKSANLTSLSLIIFSTSLAVVIDQSSSCERYERYE